MWYGGGQRGFIQHRKFLQQEEVRLSKELLDDGPDPKKEGKVAGKRPGGRWEDQLGHRMGSWNVD